MGGYHYICYGLNSLCLQFLTQFDFYLSFFFVCFVLFVSLVSFVIVVLFGKIKENGYLEWCEQLYTKEELTYIAHTHTYMYGVPCVLLFEGWIMLSTG